jgi:hypothetical protein
VTATPHAEALPAYPAHVKTCKRCYPRSVDTQNITFRVPKALLAKAKQVAAQRGTSVSALVIESLTRVTSGNEAYETAWQRQREVMRSGKRLRGEGEPLPERETAHER